jgi:hypothetical protein
MVELDFGKFPELPRGRYWATKSLGRRSRQEKDRRWGSSDFTDRNKYGDFIEVEVSLMQKVFLPFRPDKVIRSSVAVLGDSSRDYDRSTPNWVYYKHVELPPEGYEARLIGVAGDILQCEKNHQVEIAALRVEDTRNSLLTASGKRGRFKR